MGSGQKAKLRFHSHGRATLDLHAADAVKPPMTEGERTQLSGGTSSFEGYEVLTGGKSSHLTRECAHVFTRSA